MEQVETRGSRKEERHPVRAGGTGSPPESGCSPARSGPQRRGNEWEVQDPQGPGG
ncbi:Hypothetical protein HVIM_04196 [Roseomonas mucosa]|nr:Hypothetical protein HVIM_04196 [Roseomonas mucosa]QDD98659.1 Hypothetical protein ADP8_04196 [Roseomonas mucosa]UZO90853.1 Hypothetical protein RMP42_04196 [Roseomonas mucosa]